VNEDEVDPFSEAPSFALLAIEPSITPLSLNAFFATSHEGMPNLLLTSEQKAALIDYIMSLKERGLRELFGTPE
jgi:hypothetical protein